MYSARFEIPKSEILTFVSANSHLFSKCELYTSSYPEYISVFITSKNEFHVTTLDQIYHYTSDENRKREQEMEIVNLPF